MSSSNRATKFKSLQKFLQKRYKHAPQTQLRKVLEHLVYAACLENATFEQADNAFSVLEHHYIDWNEIRVSTANELAYTFPHLPDAVAAGDRVRKSLQAVFETTYMFDLEDLKKKSLSQAVEYLESLGVCSRFMIDYTAHNALGGHVIPVDESAMRVFRLLGLAQVSKDNTREEVGGLERAITKHDGHEFASLLHLFAVEFYKGKDLEELQQILKPIDPQAMQRDWTAPVLQITRPARLVEKPKPAIPLPALDDDLDGGEEADSGGEVDFIPNPITGEESSFDPDSDDEEGGGGAKKASSKSKAGAKGTKKESKEAPKKSDVKKTPTAEKPVAKSAAKPTKPAEAPAPQPVKTAETKPVVKETKPPVKKTTPKPAATPAPASAKKPPKKPAKPAATAAPKSEKSPTRTLRQKKPK